MKWLARDAALPSRQASNPVVIKAPPIRCALPLADREGAISPHFGDARFFAIVTLSRMDRRLDEQRIVNNPYWRTEKAKGIRVAEWLVAQKVDEIWMKEDLHGKGPDYVLQDAGTVIRHLDQDRLADAISASSLSSR